MIFYSLVPFNIASVCNQQKITRSPNSKSFDSCMCTCTCLFTTYTIIKYILPHQETIWKGQGRQTVSWWIWRLQWLEMEPISLVLSCLKVGEAIALFCFVVFPCVLPWACDVDALLPQLWFLLVSAGICWYLLVPPVQFFHIMTQHWKQDKSLFPLHFPPVTVNYSRLQNWWHTWPFMANFRVFQT